MCVFDRSWYGRVLVERVEVYATEEQWQRAYEEIVGFERTLVLEGVILVKFWLHISDEEQLDRFGSQADPLKRWKLTEEDWRNRQEPRYDAAAEDVFARTDHELAVGPDRRRAEALRPRRRPRTPQRTDRRRACDGAVSRCPTGHNVISLPLAPARAVP